MDGCVVYLYKDPKTDIPRYVGVGTSDARAKFHLKKNAKTNPQLKNMIEKRIAEGYIVQPVITYLGHNDFEAAKLIEINEIAKYGREDLGKGTLFNKTDGGDGGVGVIRSVETRRRISENTKAAHKDPAIAARRQIGQKEASARPDVKARRSQAQQLAQSDKTVRAKQLVSIKASESEERRAKRSEIAKIVQNRPDVKARKSASLKISANNPEIKARRSASIKAANTDEVRSKRSASMKATLARKKLLTRRTDGEVIDQLKLVDQD